MPATTMPSPRMSALVQALINQAVAQRAFLNAALAPYGAALDAATSPNDSGEYLRFKYGDRMDVAEGLSLHFIPMETDAAMDATGGGGRGQEGILREQLAVEIRGYWTNTVDNNLQEHTGQLWRMFSDLQEALAVLYRPATLGSQNGGWVLPGGAGTVTEARIVTGLPMAVAWIEKRHQMVPYFSLTFRCERWTDAP